MPKMKSLPRSYTDHIGRKAAENICHAFDYAKYIDQPLNRYVTISLRNVEDEAAAAHAFGMIRHKFRDWLVYAMKQSGAEIRRPAYVYSIEAPSAENPHVNWVAHIPPHLAAEFRLKLRGWAARVLGDVGPFDILIQAVEPTTDKSLAKYIIKGTDTRYVDYLHLGEYSAPQGRVWGRRATASPAIGRTARQRAGFKPKRDRHKWKARLLAAE